MAVKNPALGADGVDYSTETYKRRVARWRAEVLYGSPPVDHLDPIPQFPPEHKPPPFAKRPKARAPTKAARCAAAKAAKAATTADLFRPS